MITYTPSRARLQTVNDNNSGPFNWIFVAGGPGLGSESLSSLTRLLNLPGTTWHFDFPGDGSNLTADDDFYFTQWQKSLIEAAKSLENVIMVGHSTGGMYIQATPELEKLLAGVVLMDSAPNSEWRGQFNAYISANPISGIEELIEAYDKNPDNDSLKQLTLAAISWSVSEKGVKLICDEMQTWPFNNKAMVWSDTHFDPIYEAQWIPEKIPALIFAGSDDHIIPLSAFTDLPEYHRNNICIRMIKNASHFPWIENPQAVVDEFTDFTDRLLKL